MHSSIPLLAPVLVLVIWSGVIWLLMLVTRVSGIVNLRLKLDPRVPNNLMLAQLPPQVRWKADNYNHLMEQPTLFYAVALSLSLLGDASGSTVMMAWSYVVLRIAHSLIQISTNHILSRFMLFTLSSIALFAMTFQAARLVFYV